MSVLVIPRPGISCAGKRYEGAAEAQHDAGPAVQLAGVAHQHEDHSWEPRDGLERTAYTALADILAAIGYGLLLAAAFALRGGEVTGRTGLWWGLAGSPPSPWRPDWACPPKSRARRRPRC